MASSSSQASFCPFPRPSCPAVSKHSFPSTHLISGGTGGCDQHGWGVNWRAWCWSPFILGLVSSWEWGTACVCRAVTFITRMRVTPHTPSPGALGPPRKEVQKNPGSQRQPRYLLQGLVCRPAIPASCIHSFLNSINMNYLLWAHNFARYQWHKYDVEGSE